MIRYANNKEEGFSNPITQVTRQRILLQQWAQHHDLPHIPVEYLVAINDPRTIIQSDSGNSEIYERICHTDHLLNKIMNFEKSYSEVILQPVKMKKFTQLLLLEHTSQGDDIFQRFGIDKRELITGVKCPVCFSVPMVRKHGKWLCNSCQSASKDAHVQAIHDYFLLNKPTITNSELRKYLRISSKYTASRLLNALNLQSSGKGKGTIYSIDNR